MPEVMDGNIPSSPISDREAQYFNYLSEEESLEEKPRNRSFGEMFWDALSLGRGSVKPWESERDLED